jgi:hypothetical protein
MIQGADLMPSDFAGAFAELRAILRRHGRDMVVLQDTPTDFVLITKATTPDGKPMWFGAVTTKKSSVTYHLVPLYFNPKLQSAVPPELLPRKQGKTCFNFQRPDAAQFARLDALTALGRAHFERAGFLKSGQVTTAQLNAALRAAGEDPEKIAKVRTAKGKAAAAKRATTLKKKVAKSAAKR